MSWLMAVVVVIASGAFGIGGLALVEAIVEAVLGRSPRKLPRVPTDTEVARLEHVFLEPRSVEAWAHWEVDCTPCRVQLNAENNARANAEHARLAAARRAVADAAWDRAVLREGETPVEYVEVHAVGLGADKPVARYAVGGYIRPSEAVAHYTLSANGTTLRNNLTGEIIELGGEA